MGNRFAAAALACALVASPAGARVVLIGVDGASWSVLDPLLAEGRLPHLAALAERGVSAELDTVEPVISPTVWTSIATGRAPAAHGVTDFLKDARDVRVPTIFERLAVQGLRVGTYDYLVTWPPRPLPGGFVVPGWLRRDDTTWPPDAFDAAGGPDYRYRLRGTTGRAGYAALVREEIARKAGQWNALASAFAIEAGAVSFYAVDAVSHRFWHDAFPEQFDEGDVPAPEPAYAGLLEEVVVGVDAAIGEIVSGLGPQDAVIVVSDHGFRAADGFRRIWDGHVEPALARAGLVPARDAFTVEGEFGYVFVRVHPGPFAEREATSERLAAFFGGARNAAGEALFDVEILDQAERPTDARRSWTNRARQWVLRQILRRVFSVRLDPRAHAYLLMRPRDAALESAWPDGEITVGGRRMPLRDFVAGDGFTGAHDETAVLVAAGGGLRAVPGRVRASVLDVAPLLAYLAGAALPDDLAHPLPESWIEPEALAARPVRHIAADDLERLPAPDAPRGDDADVTERLRSMGYVE